MALPSPISASPEQIPGRHAQCSLRRNGRHFSGGKHVKIDSQIDSVGLTDNGFCRRWRSLLKVEVFH
jgi:hypothetical protein